MASELQQYISHVAEDGNLPEEVEDFKELQIIKGIERIMREKVTWDHLFEVGVCLLVLLETYKSIYRVSFWVSASPWGQMGQTSRAQVSVYG